MINIYASGSKGNLSTYSDGETTIIIDAGIPVDKIIKQTEINLQNIAGILLSHEHRDHSYGVKKLVQLGLNMYSSEGSIEKLNIEPHHTYKVHKIRHLEPFRINTLTIKPIKLLHDACEPLGFIICSSRTRERVLYMCDTNKVNYVLNGLTHIIIECNYCDNILMDNIFNGRVNQKLSDRIKNNHLSLQNVLDMLKTWDLNCLQQICVIHTSEKNSNPKEIATALKHTFGIANITVH